MGSGLSLELSGDVWSAALAVLADAGVKGIVLLALAGAVTLAMRRSSAAARHLVWTLAMAGMLFLPLLSLVIPKWQLPILPGASTPVEQPLPETQPLLVNESGHMEFALSNVMRPFPVVASARESAIAEPLAIAPMPVAPLTVSRSLAFRLLWAWLAGAMVFLMPLLAGLIAVGRLRRKATAFPGDRLPSLARSLADSIGLRRPVALLRAGPGAMPMAAGLFRAAVFLPCEAEDWADEKLRAVLLHELSHVCRRDCLTHALARLAMAMYWMNPLAWVALRRLRIERERACDDLVLTAGERATVYADHLLEIARTMHTGTLTSVAAITMAKKSQLEGRLLAVLDPRRNRKAIKWWAAALGIIVMLAISVPLAMIKLSEHKVFADMTPEQRAQFEDWRTRKLTFPPEAVEPKVYRAETLEAVSIFYRQWSEVGETARETEKEWVEYCDAAAHIPTLPDDFDDQLQARLQEIEPLVTAFQSVVTRPNYDTDVWGAVLDPAQGNVIQPRVDYRSIQCAARLLHFKTHVLVEQENIREAIDCGDILVQASRVHPYTTNLNRMVGMAILNMSVDVWEHVIEACDNDTALLNQALERLNARCEDFYYLPPADLAWITADHVGLIREARRWGIEADVQNKTGVQLMAEAMWVQGEYLRKYALPKANTPEQKAEIVKQIQSVEKNYPDFKDAKPSGLMSRWTRPITVAILYSIALPGIERTEAEVAKCINQYDALRRTANGAPLGTRPPVKLIAHKYYKLGEPIALKVSIDKWDFTTNVVANIPRIDGVDRASYAKSMLTGGSSLTTHIKYSNDTYADNEAPWEKLGKHRVAMTYPNVEVWPVSLGGAKQPDIVATYEEIATNEVEYEVVEEIPEDYHQAEYEEGWDEILREKFIGVNYKIFNDNQYYLNTEWRENLPFNLAFDVAIQKEGSEDQTFLFTITVLAGGFSHGTSMGSDTVNEQLSQLAGQRGRLVFTPSIKAAKGNPSIRKYYGREYITDWMRFMPDTAWVFDQLIEIEGPGKSWVMIPSAIQEKPIEDLGVIWRWTEDGGIVMAMPGRAVRLLPMPENIQPLEWIETITRNPEAFLQSQANEIPAASGKVTFGAVLSENKKMWFLALKEDADYNQQLTWCEIKATRETAEGAMAFGVNIPLKLSGELPGPSEGMSFRHVRFEKTGKLDGITAKIWSHATTLQDSKWIVDLKLMGVDGKPLAHARRVLATTRSNLGSGMGEELIIELGRWSVAQEAQRYRISLRPAPADIALSLEAPFDINRHTFLGLSAASHVHNSLIGLGAMQSHKLENGMAQIRIRAGGVMVEDSEWKFRLELMNTSGQALQTAETTLTTTKLDEYEPLSNNILFPKETQLQFDFGRWDEAAKAIRFRISFWRVDTENDDGRAKGQELTTGELIDHQPEQTRPPVKLTAHKYQKVGETIALKHFVEPWDYRTDSAAMFLRCDGDVYDMDSSRSLVSRSSSTRYLNANRPEYPWIAPDKESVVDLMRKEPPWMRPGKHSASIIFRDVVVRNRSSESEEPYKLVATYDEVETNEVEYEVVEEIPEDYFQLEYEEGWEENLREKFTGAKFKDLGNNQYDLTLEWNGPRPFNMAFDLAIQKEGSEERNFLTTVNATAGDSRLAISTGDDVINEQCSALAGQRVRLIFTPSVEAAMGDPSIRSFYGLEFVTDWELLEIEQPDEASQKENEARKAVRRFLRAMADGNSESLTEIADPSYMVYLLFTQSRLTDAEREVFRKLREATTYLRDPYDLVITNPFKVPGEAHEKVILIRLVYMQGKWVVNKYEPTAMDQIGKRVEEYEAWVKACNRPGKTPPAFAIHMVKTPVDVTNEGIRYVDLENLDLDSSPVLTDADIIAYDWNTHLVHVKPGVLDRMMPKKVDLKGNAFVVVANGERIFLGIFWSWISSYMPNVSVIKTMPAGLIQEDGTLIEDAFDFRIPPEAETRVREALGDKMLHAGEEE